MKKQLPESIRQVRPDQVSDAREWFGTSAKKIEAKEKVRKPKPQRWRIITIQSKFNNQ